MIQILFGLAALGLVILVHEAGHFIAARLNGVEVESFSIGWGPVLLRRKIGATEYRLSMLPLGGYCGMKGEHAFSEALKNNLDTIPAEAGSFYSVAPLRRIIISVAGPLANLLFAVVALTFVSMAGYEYRSYENKIVLASTILPGSPQAADQAGLKTGDRIIQIDGQPIATWADIQQQIGIRPEKTFPVLVERDGVTETVMLTPALDKQRGVGYIGIYPLVPLRVAAVQKGSSADAAGIKAGDTLVSVNGQAVTHFYELLPLFTERPEQVTIGVSRSGSDFFATLVLIYDKNGNAVTGLEWETLLVTQSPRYPLAALIQGSRETARMFVLTIKSIGLLFRGIDLGEAVSGPIRVTVMLGEVAANGFSQGLLAGFTGIAEFLAILCISLFLMNLLPIPVLDGGMILFSILEILRRKPLKPRFLYYVQFIGIAFIGGIFLFAVFGDIQFLMK